jgi:LmbE family N-acetylglucosaminyl deacetylase
MNTSKNKFAFVILLMTLVAVGPVRAQSSAAWSNGQSLPEVIEAIEKARVTTRILYVTAHPDDEPGAVLSYLARGLHADVALLSLTRGEGGQNALGPEQAPQLGVLRTEELMNATRVYGTRLFFTRAADFGYTKTSDEALKVWGDQTLEDMVRVIRTFRPHVIINSWGGVRGGHGQHVASGLLTPQAYAMAADAKAFPKLADEGLQPWKAEALLQLSRGSAPADGFSIPVSEISPLWGKSWGEIGVEGYLNHRTQGVGGVRSSPFFRRPVTLVAVDGAKLDALLLAAPLTSLAGRFAGLEDLLLQGLKDVDDSLGKAEKAAQKVDWTEVALHLSRAGRDLHALQRDVQKQESKIVERAIKELEEIEVRIKAAMVAAMGLRMEATAGRGEIVKGEPFAVAVQWRRRMEPALFLEEPRLEEPAGWVQEVLTEKAVGSVNLRAAPTKQVEIEKDEAKERQNHRIADSIFPWPEPLATVSIFGMVHAYRFIYEVPVTATRVTSVSAETRPLLLVPAVTLTVEPKEIVVVRGGNQKSEIRNQKQIEREIVVRVRHYATATEKITVGIEVPAGWSAPSPNGAGQTVEFTGAGDQLVRFTVRPPAKIAAGKYELKAYAKRADGEEFRTSLEPLPTLPTRMWSEPAVARVHVMDVTVPKNLRVGYVTAENDLIPQALREIGVHVELLDEAALAFGELSKYDAICIGIRAYELRSDLARANQRLLDYAAAGGTLVVQYQREGVWNQLKPAPYAATIGNGLRTTDENSPVRILEPLHPLLNFPNVIRIEDYSGWVQERGLYYWGTFDAKYTPVLAMKDPGEQEALGALVYAKHGKGVYIYTGLSFFRQLPEGVPGAYRLFVNLLSQGRRKIE